MLKLNNSQCKYQISLELFITPRLHFFKQLNQEVWQLLILASIFYFFFKYYYYFKYDNSSHHFCSIVKGPTTKYGPLVIL